MIMAERISDEELTAYLDGEADGPLRVRIDAELESDTELLSRLEALTIDVSALKSDFDALLRSAPAGLIPPPVPAFNPWRTSVAMAASLIIGLGAGYLFFSKPAPAQAGWTQYVAAYQALYVVETLETVPLPNSVDVSGLSETLGRELDAATTAPGLLYKRGQVLGFKGKPLIQMAYLSDTGAPVALCIIRKEGSETAITHSELEGMKAASWSDGTFAYLLIGGTDADVIARNAAHFKASL